MTRREKILAALDIQESIEGGSDDIDLLRKVVNIMRTEDQFYSLVKTAPFRYGVLSYEVYKFYYPSPELLKLLAL